MPGPTTRLTTTGDMSGPKTRPTTAETCRVQRPGLRRREIVADVAAMMRQTVHLGAALASVGLHREDLIVPRPPLDLVLAVAIGCRDEWHERVGARVVPRRMVRQVGLLRIQYGRDHIL